MQVPDELRNPLLFIWAIHRTGLQADQPGHEAMHKLDARVSKQKNESAQPPHGCQNNLSLNDSVHDLNLRPEAMNLLKVQCRENNPRHWYKRWLLGQDPAKAKATIAKLCNVVGFLSSAVVYDTRFDYKKLKKKTH